MSKQDVTNPAIGSIYLQRVYFNSKKITWQACMFLGNSSDRWIVQDLEDNSIRHIEKTSRRLSKNKKFEGGYGFIEESTLRAVTHAWKKAEMHKCIVAIAAATQRYNMLLNDA